MGNAEKEKSGGCGRGLSSKKVKLSSQAKTSSGGQSQQANSVRLRLFGQEQSKPTASYISLHLIHCFLSSVTIIHTQLADAERLDERQ